MEKKILNNRLIVIKGERVPNVKASDIVSSFFARRSGRSHDGDTGQLAEPPALRPGQKADAVFPATAANQQ